MEAEAQTQVIAGSGLISVDQQPGSRGAWAAWGFGVGGLGIALNPKP